MGLPGVYSDVPAYATCEHGATALLADNTAEAWAAALARLWTDADLRSRLADAGRRYALSERCVAYAVGDYLDLLCGAVLDAAEASPTDPARDRRARAEPEFVHAAP